MKPWTSEQRAGWVSLGFFMILVLNYWVYPGWLAYPIGDRFVYYVGAVAVSLISLYFLYKLSCKAYRSEKEQENKKDLFKVWLVLIGILILTHAWALSKPMVYPGDEDYFLGRGAYLYKSVEGLKSQFPGFGVTSFFILLLLGVCLFRKRQPLMDWVVKHKWKIVGFLGIMGIVVTYLIHVNVGSIVAATYAGTDYRPDFFILVEYPPISAYLYTASFFFFGYNLFAQRLVELLFFSGALLYLYRIIKLLTGNELAAWFGPLLLAFLPAGFYYANTGFLDNALLLFEFAPAYYLINYLKTHKNSNAVAFCLVVVIGIFFKDIVNLMVPLCLTYLALYHLAKKRELTIRVVKSFFVEHGTFIWLALLSLFATGVWAFTQVWLQAGNHEFHIAWIWGEYASIMIKGLLVEFPYGLITVFGLGVVYALWSRRADLLFLPVWFLFFFLLFASHMGSANLDVYRYSLHYSGPIVILITIFLFWLVDKVRGLYWLPWLGLALVMTTTLVACYEKIDDRYLPYDPAYAKLSVLMKGGDKVFALGSWSVYYQAKYGLDRNRLLTYDIMSDRWIPREGQSLDRLYKQAKEEGVRYILAVDDQPAYVINLFKPSSFTWGNEIPRLNPQLVRDLNANQDVRFKLLDRFHYSVNRLSIFEIS